MRMSRAPVFTAVTVLLTLGIGRLSLLQSTALPIARATSATHNLAVGPQYNTTHIYVAPEDFDRFVTLASDKSDNRISFFEHFTCLVSAFYQEIELGAIQKSDTNGGFRNQLS